MRTYGAPSIEIPGAPDTVQTILLGSGTAQAMDWAGSTVGSSASAAHLVRFTGQSSAGGEMNFYVSLNSTQAANPTSGLSTGSTGGALPSAPVWVSRVFTVPPGSTGFSVIARSSGYVHAEIWRR